MEACHDFPYHWVNEVEQKQYGHLANEVPHDHWQALNAIREAISRLPHKNQERVKQLIFHDNAKEFYGF